MDFRTVDVPGLQWSASAKGPRNIQKVTIQTPRCNCTVSPAAGGARKVELRVPAAFGDFLDSIDDSAREAFEDSSGFYSSTFNGRMRLMAFSDVLCFDAAGALSQDPYGAKSAAVVLELGGTWSAGSKKGVRWKMAQMKFWDDAVEMQTEDDDDEPAATAATAATAAFAFLDD
jgi:hypothetical protein